MNDANTRDKIPAFDRSALDTQEWRPVVFECIELLVWRLLDEHGEVLDEGPDCPGAGFSEDSLLNCVDQEATTDEEYDSDDENVVVSNLA